MLPRFSRHAMAACAIAACTVSLPAFAEIAPIATDRPDFVESSAVVGKGRLQVETSVAIERDRSAGARDTAWSTPTLVRFGISESIELRVETDGPTRQRSSVANGPAQTERGYADASLGMKWHAMDASGSLPAVAVLLHADLSSGSTAFREAGTRPSLRVVAEWELDNDFSFGVMPGIAHEKAHGGSTYGILGVVVGKAWNDRLRSFAEVSSPHLARSSKGGLDAILTVGSAYLVTPTMQIDAAVSTGLNSRTPDLGVTFGLSFKL